MASTGGSFDELVNVQANSFRPKVESGFTRLEQVGPHWLATDKKGTRYYFGRTEESRQQKSPGNVFSWRLDKAIDIHGKAGGEGDLDPHEELRLRGSFII